MHRRGPRKRGNPAQNSEVGGKKERTESASKVRPWRVNESLEAVRKRGTWEARQKETEGTPRLG